MGTFSPVETVARKLTPTSTPTTGPAGRGRASRQTSQVKETNHRPASRLKVAERMRAVAPASPLASLVVGSWVFTPFDAGAMRGRAMWCASTTRNEPVVKRHEARQRRFLRRGQPILGPVRFPDADSK